MRYDHLSDSAGIREDIKVPRVSSKADKTERHQIVAEHHYIKLEFYTPETSHLIKYIFMSPCNTFKTE